MPKVKKLLIVDDSTVSRMMIRKIVGNLRPDWQCSEAANGAEGLQLALDNIFDFATVDINMPIMNGLDLTRQLRAECPQMRVCLLTANIQEESQRLADELKVGFIRKPITEARIAEAISHLEGQHDQDP